MAAFCRDIILPSAMLRLFVSSLLLINSIDAFSSLAGRTKSYRLTNTVKSLSSRDDDNNDDDEESFPRGVDPPRKFTGAPLYSGESLFETSAQQRERQQEFQLAGRFEQTLGLQAGFVALALVFVIYVGLTGGITNGEDRFADDEIDIMGENYWDRQESIEVIRYSSEGNVVI